MHRTETPCSSSNHSTSRVTSPVDKESLRKQIVGLAVRRDAEDKSSPSSDSSTPRKHKQIQVVSNFEHRAEKEKENQSSSLPKRSRFYGPGTREINGSRMPQMEPHEVLRKALRRSKTSMNGETKSKPKIVRFRMDELNVGGQKASIVNITDANDAKSTKSQQGRFDIGQTYEVRGNAINVRKEGLRGLLEYKDLCTENERRQNSLQTSLKIFRRRIKLNEEKFIQPNETTTEDYVIHRRSPFCEIQQTTSAEDQPPPRPLSSSEHFRLLRSALQNKHNGGSVVKYSETTDTGESSKNIKCSYRLPENPNWGKEVSFKDIKDDSIPNVKTYVVEDDKETHSKFRKNSLQNAVTLNIHNLNVHNSISHVTGKKVKVGDSEVSFDPRFLDWIEDSMSNMKLYKDASFVMEEKIDTSITPTTRRKIPSKS